METTYPTMVNTFLIFLFFFIFYWSKNSLIINELNQQRKNSRQHINTLKTQLIQNITKNKLNTLINQRKQQITDLLTSMQQPPMLLSNLNFRHLLQVTNLSTGNNKIKIIA